MNKINCTCTHTARIMLEKELKSNKIPFEHGETIYRYVLENTVKSRMAIQMVKERLGNQIVVK